MTDLDIALDGEEKKNNILLYIIIAGAILLLFFWFLLSSSNKLVEKKDDGNGIIVDDSNKGDSGIGVDDNGNPINDVSNDSGDFINITFYDKDRNPIIINSLSTLSIINGVPKVKYMVFTVSITNKGVIPLICSILSVEPPFINSGDFGEEKVVLIGSKKSWTSDYIETSQFEGSPTPDIIDISSECNYNKAGSLIKLPKKSGFLEIKVNPDSNVTFVKTRIYEKSGRVESISHASKCGDDLIKYKYLIQYTHNRNEITISCPTSEFEFSSNAQDSYKRVKDHYGVDNLINLILLANKNEQICFYNSEDKFFAFRVVNPTGTVINYQSNIMKYDLDLNNQLQYDSPLRKTTLEIGESELYCSTSL